MTPKPVVVGIEGNIGVGKTSFRVMIEGLFPGLRVLFLQEPLDLWTCCGPNKLNILKAFYDNPREYAFAFQSFAIATRNAMLAGAMNSGEYDLIFMERTPFSDSLFTELCKQNGYIDEIEYAAYCEWRDYLFNLARDSIDFIFYLRASPETCLKRVQERSRDEELKTVDLDYLKKLHDLHEQWLYPPMEDFFISIEGKFRKAYISISMEEPLAEVRKQVQKNVPSLIQRLFYSRQV